MLGKEVPNSAVVQRSGCKVKTQSTKPQPYINKTTGRAISFYQ
ncbi:hypothetical protein D778_00873 [Xanthomarina gelatinilytica]|uniref:Uncharacterized protein n=1 Tax=Xanthomarina gelatinilytica TaxID=1137281 RepID=M7MGX0_9FLAO|nr:hypothetical protein D778_00873 [Xanthomarina gelatinilytica]